MKRLILLSTVLALTACGMKSFAIVDTNRLMSEDYMLNQGYSPEIVRMMNLRIVDPYAPHEVKEKRKNAKDWIKRFYQYVDPATDYKFGDGIIDPRMDRPSQMF